MLTLNTLESMYDCAFFHAQLRQSTVTIVVRILYTFRMSSSLILRGWFVFGFRSNIRSMRSAIFPGQNCG